MNKLKEYTECSIAQMRREIEEYKVEGSRMAQVLDAVGIDIYQRHPKIDNQLVKTLSTAADALCVIDFDNINLELAASDLKNGLRKSERDVENIRRRIQLYKKNFRVFSERKKRIESANSYLMGKQDEYMQELTKTAKSSLFHSKKKTQYLTTLHSTRKRLSGLGYEENLSHKKLTELGVEVGSMEEHLKRLRLSLKSYEDLPPSLAGAQIKVEEKKSELGQLEMQLADKLGDISVANLHEK